MSPAFLKHTTTLFSLSEHDVHSKQGMESYCWSSTDQIIVGLLYYNHSGVTELLIMKFLIMVGVLSQLKPSVFSIINCEEGLGPGPPPFHLFYN